MTTAPILAGHKGTIKAKCLCVDIETARQDRTILREIGVYRPDLDATAKIPGKAKGLVRRLDELTAGAASVLGHNQVRHKGQLHGI